MFIQFKIVDGGTQVRPFSLENLEWEKSTLSRKFRAIKTSDDFMAIWLKDVAPYLNATSGTFTPPDDTHDTQAMDEPQPRKRMKIDEKALDSDIESCYIGEFLWLQPLFY